jgi:hypothetical protein
MLSNDQLGVKLGHSAMSAQCPHCPKADVDSQKCQKETFAISQPAGFSFAAHIHLGGAAATQVTTGDLAPIRDQVTKLEVARIDFLGKLVARSNLGDDIFADSMDGV